VGQGFLIDTNVAIDYLGGKFNSANKQFVRKIIDDHFYLSVINEIELLSYNATESEIKIIHTFINGAYVMTMNQEIVNETIHIRRNKNLKLPDAVIAATAIVFNLTLLTRNLKDFSKALASNQLINLHAR
jgi:predicted nucleic acid-binding protein